jgi:hypothetical protein
MRPERFSAHEWRPGQPERFRCGRRCDVSGSELPEEKRVGLFLRNRFHGTGTMIQSFNFLDAIRMAGERVWIVK